MILQRHLGLVRGASSLALIEAATARGASHQQGCSQDQGALVSANQPETVAGVEPGPTLVYCATRTNVERVTRLLETMALLRCTMRVWRCPIKSLFKKTA